MVSLLEPCSARPHFWCCGREKSWLVTSNLSHSSSIKKKKKTIVEVSFKKNKYYHQSYFQVRDWIQSLDCQTFTTHGTWISNRNIESSQCYKFLCFVVTLSSEPLIILLRLSSLISVVKVIDFSCLNKLIPQGGETMGGERPMIQIMARLIKTSN